MLIQSIYIEFFYRVYKLWIYVDNSTSANDSVIEIITCAIRKLKIAHKYYIE